MKTNFIYLVTTLFITIIGLVLKNMDIVGGGTIMGLGFLTIITLSTVLFLRTAHKKVSNTIFWVFLILIPVLLFTIIQKRQFSEIFTAAIVWTILVFLITALTSWVRILVQKPK